jgi:hypothetical protein
MKTTSQFLFAMAIAGIFVTSCKKDKDQQIPPTMSFKTGSGYVSTSDTLSMNDTIVVGITAAKSEAQDLLTRFVATQKYDAGTATSFINESFNQDNYSKDMTIITRNVAGTEAYTFTIINRDGLTKTLALTFTVN